ncbi:hypothetical protein QBC47DRAFT_369830 [Echria macrotheca]|uniref:Uncharacterized protein n=1 Tax=Echria macrotheca TaxID=438768 RepID=A0AAJ0BNV4_9PEZI|nr:hypothetical protein QBC47DRAFT_369830 [Echria macrotheca]
MGGWVSFLFCLLFLLFMIPDTLAPYLGLYFFSSVLEIWWPVVQTGRHRHRHGHGLAAMMVLAFCGCGWAVEFGSVWLGSVQFSSVRFGDTPEENYETVFYLLCT